MSTRLKQVLLVLIGVVGATVMVFLGLWQMQVFIDKGNHTIEDRAAQHAGALDDYLGPHGEVTGDIYGKQVTITGTYLPGQQLLVPTDGSYRVLAAFEIRDGRVLPVIRGVTDDPDAIPTPPPGERMETGLFLPGEGNATTPAPEGMIGSVRMPLLAQEWPQQLTPGFVTLDAPDAAAHGLAEAPVDLPQGEGSSRNSGYALQWWVFAAFGLAFFIVLARHIGIADRADAPGSPEPALAADPEPTTPHEEGTRPMGMSLDDSPLEADDLPGIKGALLRYRVMAYIVGVLLVVLVVVGMPLKYVGGNDAVVVATGVPHGWLYMVLLFTAYDLGRRVKWPWMQLILIALGGTVPFMSFVAEHYATKDVRTRIAAVEGAPAAAR